MWDIGEFGIGGMEEEMIMEMHLGPNGYLHLKAKIAAVESMRMDPPEVSSPRQDALDAFEYALKRGTIHTVSFGTANQHLKEWAGEPIAVVVHFEEDDSGLYVEPSHAEECTRLLIQTYLNEPPEAQQKRLAYIATCTHM